MLARVLRAAPAIALLDEPRAALQAAQGQAVLRLLWEEEGCRVVELGTRGQ